MLPGVTLLDVSPQIIFSGENLVTRECEILEVSGRRMVVAGVADAEVYLISVFLQVLSQGETLVAVRAFVRARHLVDSLDVYSEVPLLAESFATGRTLKVLDLSMDGFHVAPHDIGTEEDFLTNTAFLTVFCSFLIVAFGETDGLMIHKSLAVGEDFLAAFAD